MTILMIGPDINARGGIASVLDLYRQGGLMEKVRLMASTTDGSVGERIRHFGRFLRDFTRTLKTDPAIRLVHIHIAVKGSIARKSLVVALARLHRKKIVLHFHGAQFNVLYENSPFWLRKLLVWSFRTADQVLCLSDECRTHILEMTGVSAIVMPNPTRLQAPVSQATEPVHFLFMGRLGKRKGVYDLVAAARKIEPGKGILHLYGDGELDEVRQKIRELGVEDRVFVHGWVSGNEKAGIFEKSHVLVLPSYNEGLPISILEALAYGMPVISTPVGGIPDAVEDSVNGFLVEPGDIDDIAESINRLAGSPTLREAMGQAGYRKAQERFDLPQVIGRLETLYDTLLHPAKFQPN